jgi:hypothetical protein
MFKWREMATNAAANATKSEAAAEKAEAVLTRARGSGRPTDISKAETIHAAAKRKAEDDRNSATDQAQTLNSREPEYQRKFLESLVAPLTAAINVRFKSSEKMLSVASEFEAAVEKFTDYEDATVEKLSNRLKEMEEEVVE